MAKLFISQPMKGLTDQQILEVREKAIERATVHIKEVFGKNEPVQVLESFFQGAPADAKPLWYLGESIKLLAQADVAYFCTGWDNARGCVIENICAIDYDPPLVIEDHAGYTEVTEKKGEEIIQTTTLKRPVAAAK